MQESHQRILGFPASSFPLLSIRRSSYDVQWSVSDRMDRTRSERYRGQCSSYWPLETAMSDTSPLQRIYNSKLTISFDVFQRLIAVRQREPAMPCRRETHKNHVTYVSVPKKQNALLFLSLSFNNRQSRVATVFVTVENIFRPIWIKILWYFYSDSD